jgi:putative hydrolase of the HAD superfamily
VSDFSPPDAILLDALGTLVELEPPAPRLRQELTRRFGIVVSEALTDRAIAAEIAYYRANLDSGRDAESLSALRARCAEVVRAELGSVLVGITTPELTDALLTSIRFRAYPDVRPALLAARVRGIRLVVVSNWDASLQDVLARLELTPLLDGIVTSAQSGARKPSAAIFEHGLSLAGTIAERSIHVGDSVREDVAGARAAGIEALLLLRDGGPVPPGVRAIRSLAELASYS